MTPAETVFFGNLAGQVMLSPAYGSLIYYAQHPTKPMHGQWKFINTMSSLAIGGIGGVCIYLGVTGSDRTLPNYLGIGLPYVVSSAFVLGATAWRSGHPSPRTSAMILPYGSSTMTNGTNVGVMAVGQF
ncbi:MAG: hypothetical protein IPM54_16270 [Polyangiaceae bacterium]|nr:hypothetical protein [Polyangiaceae bacterium]